MSQFSFSKTEAAAEQILEGMDDMDRDYAVLGSGMVIGRLMNMGKKLEPEEEVAWLQALMEWADLYWAPSGGVN